MVSGGRARIRGGHGQDIHRLPVGRQDRAEGCGISWTGGDLVTLLSPVAGGEVSGQQPRGASGADRADSIGNPEEDEAEVAPVRAEREGTGLQARTARAARQCHVVAPGGGASDDGDRGLLAVLRHCRIGDPVAVLAGRHSGDLAGDAGAQLCELAYLPRCGEREPEEGRGEGMIAEVRSGGDKRGAAYRGDGIPGIEAVLRR